MIEVRVLANHDAPNPKLPPQGLSLLVTLCVVAIAVWVAYLVIAPSP